MTRAKTLTPGGLTRNKSAITRTTNMQSDKRPRAEDSCVTQSCEEHGAEPRAKVSRAETREASHLSSDCFFAFCVRATTEITEAADRFAQWGNEMQYEDLAKLPRIEVREIESGYKAYIMPSYDAEMPDTEADPETATKCVAIDFSFDPLKAMQKEVACHLIRSVVFNELAMQWNSMLAVARAKA